jgi:hypothetical protein
MLFTHTPDSSCWVAGHWEKSASNTATGVVELETAAVGDLAQPP